MKASTFYMIVLLSCFHLAKGQVSGQNSNSWSLNKCILYALEHNIQVKQSILTTDVNKVTAEQTKANRLPVVNGNISQNLRWNDLLIQGTTSSYTFSGSTNGSYGVNASSTLYNGSKISNSIKQTQINFEAGKYDSETQKETISLNVLNAFLNLLFAEEQVKNNENQIIVTEGELKLANERYTLGAIANSDLLVVKSQLATEKQTLATAEGVLSSARVILMQLMELPVSNDFSIEHPDLSNLVVKQSEPDPAEIYQIALGIKPQIKSAELNTQSAKINVDLAKGNYFPNFSLNAGLGTDYFSTAKSMSYNFQISHNFSPFVGLSISIPIYENKQIKSQVDIAQIGTQKAMLQTLDTKNQLRKAIESACTDVISAEKEYTASQEQYKSNQESFAVATEKFNQGLINSVDYLVQKTNLITSESTLLQSKYKLIFSYKTLDFYTGIPLTL
jgi:outer membrane protein